MERSVCTPLSCCARLLPPRPGSSLILGFDLGTSLPGRRQLKQAGARGRPVGQSLPLWGSGSIDGSGRFFLGGSLGGVCAVMVAAAALWADLPAMAAAVPPPASASTPYSQSEGLQLGLRDGRIQACPLDINPNCVSTSSNNSGYAFPWIVPETSSSNAVKKIESAILATQKNPEIVKLQETELGTYLVAEIDGFFGRDVMEFLVKSDVVTYRSMAKKVVYVYPFTTPLGDFGTQQKRLKVLEEELGWSLPSYENSLQDV